MKVAYLTKYCLTYGIIPVAIKSKSHLEALHKFYPGFVFIKKGEAVSSAIEARDRKIRLMEKTISQLRSKAFSL